MFQSALAWTLTAAFLMTVPVTGADLCPCRLVKAYGKTAALAAPTTAPPQTCKECCQARYDKAPDRPARDWQPPPCPQDAPADAPCDHKLVAEAAPAGERSDTRGVWDAGPPAGAQPASHLIHTPAAPDRPTPMPSVGRDSLRYAHAFRS